MSRFRSRIAWVAITLIGGGLAPAWGDDTAPPEFDACRRAALRSGIDPSACFAAELGRLDARLRGLVHQRGRSLATDKSPNPTQATHDRWQRAATAFCAGVAATEPMPTYEAALLDCAVSVLADKVATLEAESLLMVERASP